MELKALRDLVNDTLDTSGGLRDSRTPPAFDMTTWFVKAASTLGYVRCALDQMIEGGEVRAADGPLPDEFLCDPVGDGLDHLRNLRPQAPGG